MNYLDLAILVVFALVLWFGYRRGIISLLGGPAGKVLSLFLALSFARPAAEWAGPRLGLMDWLTERMFRFFSPGENPAVTDVGRVTAQKLPEVLDGMGLPPLLKYKVMEKAPELMAGGSASLTAIIQELANQTAFLVVEALAFLFLLVLGGLAIRLLVGLVTHVLAGTLLGALNRLLGMVLCLSLTLVFAVLVIGLTAPLILAPPVGEPGSLAALVKGSFFYPRFLEAYGLLLGAFISR